MRALPLLAVVVKFYYMLFASGVQNEDFEWYYNMYNSHNGNPISFIPFYYNTWSSRVLIDYIALVMSHNLEVFYIITTLLLVIFLSLIVHAFQLSILSSLALAVVLLLISPTIFDFSAGGMITTIYYVWIYCFMGISLYYNYQSLRNQRLKWYQYILTVISTVLTVCMEQTLVIMFLLTIFLNIYNYYKKKKINKILCCSFIITIIGLINAMLCPGTKFRSTYELRWFPNFMDLSLFRKIDGGFQTTLHYYTIEFGLLCGIILLLLCYIVTLNSSYNISLHQELKQKNNHSTVRPDFIMVGIVLIYLAFYFPQYIPSTLPNSPLQQFITDKFLSNQNATIYISNTGFQLENLVNDCYYLIFACILLVIIYRAFSNSIQGLSVGFVLLTAFAARMIMSFSPTLIVANGYRTFVFSNILLIGIVAYLISYIQRQIMYSMT